MKSTTISIVDNNGDLKSWWLNIGSHTQWNVKKLRQMIEQYNGNFDINSPDSVITFETEEDCSFFILRWS
jgi:hypothetical protein